MSRSAHKSKAPKRAAKARDASNVSDPIFPAIKAHEAACNAIMAYCNRREDVPRTLTHDKELRALARTTPRTPEGVRALGSHVAKWWDNFFNDVADPEIKRVFQSLARAMTAKATADPVYPAIAKNWAGWLAYKTALDSNRPEPEINRALDAYWKTWDRLSTIKPTTTAGVGALLDYVSTVEQEMSLEDHEPHEFVALMRTLAESPVNALYPPALKSHIDLMRTIRPYCRKSVRAWQRKQTNRLAIDAGKIPEPAKHSATKRDPIFRALDATERARKAFAKVADRSKNPRAFDAALNHHETEISKLCRTVPETRAGTLALIAYIRKQHDDDLEAGLTDERKIEMALDSVRDAVMKLGGVV